jgi:diguanylate cyclase (GGDEF)-like protein
MRLAFLDLPDDRVDLISLARRTAGVEIVLVAHPNPDSLALRMAEVLQIPRSTEPLDLLPLKPDRVALPSLETPSAEALARAGISGRIFTTLDDLADSLHQEDGYLDVGTHPQALPGNGASVGGAHPAEVARPEPKGNGGIPAAEVQDLDLWEVQFDQAVGKLDRIREALDFTEDRRKLLREVLALAVEQTSSDAGSIMLLDEAQGELRIAVAEGLSSDTVRTTRQKLGEGIAGTVARDGKPLVIRERATEAGATGASAEGSSGASEERDRPRIRAAMCAPVVAGGRVLGVINVSTDRPERTYESTDLDRLVTVATRVAEILDRVSDLERRDADAAEFRARRALDEVMARDDLSRDRRLELALACLASLFQAKAGRLYLADSDAMRFRILGSSPSGEGVTLSMNPGLLATVYESGEPVYLASRLRPAAAGVGNDSNASVRAMNLLLVAFTGSKRTGVLTLECLARPAHDLEAQTRLVSRLAGYLAQLLERSREASAARQGALLAQLAEIAPRLMVPHAVETLLTEVVSALRSLFPRGLVSIRLRSATDDLLSRVAFEGIETDREALCGLDQELATLALGHGIESCSAAGAGESVPGAGVLEYVTVPIRCADRTVGALGTSRPARAGQDPDAALGTPELDAARKLGLYVGLAWERARSATTESRPMDDTLTGLLGASGLEARLLEEVKRVERYHDRFLLTLLSISGFDRLAQRCGQEWADDLIREFAAVLARNVREVDVIARTGGGRFVILSPETEQDGGALLRRLDQLLTSLEVVRTMPDASDVRLLGRQVTYPDEVPSGGELLAMIRSEPAAS